MTILLISLLLMFLCFIGILNAQDMETVSTLTGVGGGVGGVGGGAGVVSYLKSHQTGKTQHDQGDQINQIWNKLSNIENQNTAQDGEKKNLALQLENLHREVTDTRTKVDNIQRDVHNMALDFARAVPSPYVANNPHHPHPPTERADPL